MVAGAAQISSVVPALVGAFVILMTGYFLARQVQRWADETLKRLKFDRMVSAGGFDEVVDRAGLRSGSGAGAGQADLLAGNAGGDSAGEHRARAREHQ